MYPSYSPLFTLGLLADRSRSPPAKSSRDDNTSAFYLTLRTRKRDSLELRSFLYLDLADHKRYTRSHRRKHSALSESSSWTCTDTKSLFDFARIDKSTIMSLAPVLPARRRTSKESLRNIPSPKPAPATTLPDLPTAFDIRPALSYTPPSSMKKRLASTATSSPLSPTFRLLRPASLRSESISSHDRRKRRMDALACLEGRSRVPNRLLRTSNLRNNFMSFSDDEDEKSTRKLTALSVPVAPVIQGEDSSAFADVEDEVDAIIPTLARKSEIVARARPARSARHARKRRSTIESWFPLKSFIDFKDDDLSTWNWRSFIEIGGLS